MTYNEASDKPVRNCPKITCADDEESKTAQARRKKEA